MTRPASEEVFPGARPEPPSEEVVRVRADDGVTLALTVLPPKGRPRGSVVLLHGFSQNRQAFLRGHLPGRLRAAGLVVALAELRGHGRSDRPARWSLEDHLHLDLPALARSAESLGGGAPHLVGHSMGGILGFASLARNPGWRSLTAIAAPLELGRGSPLVGLAARAVGPAAWLGRSYPVPMDRFLGALSGPLSSAEARLPLRAAQRILALANPREADSEVIRQVLSESEPESMDVFRAFLRFALRGRGVLCGVGLERAVRCAPLPVAVISGGRDIFAPPKSVACLAAPGHAGPRRMVVLPSASHVDLTVGARVAQTVEGLLSFLEVP